MPSRWRFVLLGVLAALAVSLAACGDDDEDATQLTITAGAKGAIEVPESADPGLAEITLENSGQRPVGAQLIRVEGDHTAAEVVRVFGGPDGGGPPKEPVLPDWLFRGGGVPITEPGQSQTVTQVLDDVPQHVPNGMK